MNDARRTIDLDYYKREIAPVLPERVLDFHAHCWNAENWKERPWETDKSGGKYVVTDAHYPAEQLLRDGEDCFPDREYRAVCFGYPTPAMDWEKDTAYVARAAGGHENLYPLVVGGKDLGISRERYERALREGGFYGFKVFLNWYGNDYGNVRVEDMLGSAELDLANERALVLTLHVPSAGRLADPDIQAGVQWLSRACPGAQIVLAHCGRCYLPGEMKAAIGCLRDLPNVRMDTSMVMDPVVVQIALNEIGPQRLLFGTDFPPARMWGRRVRVKDHWVDVVLDGYAESAFRVAGSGIHAGSMVWEMVLAIRWAAELTGIPTEDMHGMFWDNGMALLQRVKRAV